MLSKLVIVAFITIVEAVSAQVITEVRQFYSPSLNQSRTVIVHKPTSATTESTLSSINISTGLGKSTE